MVKTFPKLYKKSSKGMLQEWDIFVDNQEIVVTHGLQLGKKQVDRKTVKSGKNPGKENETTPEEQAVFEAGSKWKKQLDKGYVEDLSAVDDVVYLPMLAQTFSKIDSKTGKEKGRKKYIKYPCLGQIKFDGVRSFSVTNPQGEVIIESRKGKQFPHLEHLFSQIKSVVGGRNMILDGELFSDEMNFQRLVGLVKRQTLKDGDAEAMQSIKLRAYDCIFKGEIDLGFEERYARLKEIIEGWNGHLDKIVLVENYEIKSEDDVQPLHDKFVTEGHEGLILRNKNGKYALNKRSNDLQKHKGFQDDEFEITDVIEGEGRAEGTAIFVCKTKSGNSFKARPEGTDEYRRRIFDEREELIGKMVTVRYFELTSGDKVPRFPVAKTIRDYE